MRRRTSWTDLINAGPNLVCLQRSDALLRRDETGLAAAEAGDMSARIKWSCCAVRVRCTVGQCESVTTAKRRLTACALFHLCL